MADYLITGKKGSGKSLAAVGRIRDALIAGKKVATNLNIDLEQLCLPTSKKTIIRLPDYPSIEDMELIGRGQEGKNEEDNGLIVLDECAAWLNARSWGDKQRQPLLDWFIHSRKLGWDTMFIAQGPAQIDKQVRDTLVEFHVPCKRMDRLAIPFITPLTKFLGFKINPPKLHVGIVKYGVSHDAMVVDRWYYRAKDLYNAYDTEQRFLPPDHPKACAIHTVLSPWHTKGRYMPAEQPSQLGFYASLIWRIPFYFLNKLAKQQPSATRITQPHHSFR